MAKQPTGSEFRKLRETIGWSRTQLATMLGCDERVIRNIENGDRAVQPDVFASLSGIAAAVRVMPKFRPLSAAGRPRKQRPSDE